jgi:AcrR family transcriptional regulator
LARAQVSEGRAAGELQGPARRGGRRAEMARAAARLFAERGYHGTSMQDLADALGLLRGSLYAHIGSKQDLLADVVEDGADHFLERGRRAQAMAGSAEQRLTEFLVGHSETAIGHLEAATVFLNEWRYLDAERRARVKAKRDDYESILRAIISDGIAAGEFRSDLDVAMTGRLLLSAGNWLYTWYRPKGRLAPAEIGECFAQTLVRGLKEGS